MLTRTRSAFLAVAALLALAAMAQQPAKRPLTHQDYDSWRTIQTPTLSRDGKYVAYALFPAEGDGELVVRNLATGREQRENIGALPPAPDTTNVEAPTEAAGPSRSIQLAFTSDSRFVAATTFPPKAATDQARKDRKRPDEMPKGGLLLIDLTGGEVIRIADVASMQVPEKNPGWVAYLKTPKPAERTPATDAGGQRNDGFIDQGRGGRGAAAGGAGRRQYGSDLVLRDLSKASDNERVFADALDYSFPRDGKTLVYTVGSRNEESDGIYAATPGDAAAPVTLLQGKGKYTRLAWDREQTELAFLSDRDDAAAKQPQMKVYLWNRRGAATEAVSKSTPGFRADYGVSGNGALSFSRDGKRLFLGTAPESLLQAAAPAAESTGAAAPDTSDKVVADLWRWDDDYIQPMQKVRAAQDRNRSYRAVYDLAEKKFAQLSDPEMEGLTPSDDGLYAMGTDDRPYRRMVDYDGNYSDVYIVDAATGARKKILEEYRGGGGGGRGGGGSNFSPDGRHLLFFDKGNWFAVSVPGGTKTDLTSKLPVKFYNELDDTPAEPASYGNAGWTKDSQWVLLYDRYDVWQISPDGKTARDLTGGLGRREKTQFRVVRLDQAEEREEEDRGIDPAEPLLLRAENEDTRDSGFYRVKLGESAPPKKLLMGAKNYRTVTKARDADVVLVTALTFNEEPNLHATDSTFRTLRRVSDANPQKAQMLWGTGEMMWYRNADGVKLQAALYKPENFDPKKKYPLMVYIYERLSQSLNNFVPPRPGTSINISYYVSNGYLVLTPDIIYTIGSPGQSALKCVLPAIQAVVDRGYVNEDAIGIQGHSWGGYQIAYMVTQTSRFKAAEAGAPVGDMISAYDGIRWGSGLPRQFQYEKTQSRIGGTLWEKPMNFIENSPVFMANRVTTPLLILQNDGDDAVPWYQGVELFLSLRRLGKEAYLFDYNGEPHGLHKRQDMKDYTVRMQEFFDHFLKGAPAPDWMTMGIPYVDRDKGFNGAGK